jgi:hypothetical protein
MMLVLQLNWNRIIRKVVMARQKKTNGNTIMSSQVTSFVLAMGSSSFPSPHRLLRRHISNGQASYQTEWSMQTECYPIMQVSFCWIHQVGAWYQELRCPDPFYHDLPSALFF